MNLLTNRLIKASEIYGNQTLIRAGINAIPFIGGSLDILLSSRGQTFIVKRIEQLISNLEVEISKLDESKVNTKYLESEEAFDLIVASFNYAARTRQREKLQLYSQIIRGAITQSKQFEEEEPELFLKIVEELSVKELRVAKCLFELKELKTVDPADETSESYQNGMSDDAYWLSKHYPEFNKDELISIFIRLEKTGLIKELVGSFIGYGGGQYLINPLFKKFMTFIAVSE